MTDTAFRNEARPTSEDDRADKGTARGGAAKHTTAFAPEFQRIWEAAKPWAETPAEDILAPHDVDRHLNDADQLCSRPAQPLAGKIITAPRHATPAVADHGIDSENVPTRRWAARGAGS